MSPPLSSFWEEHALCLTEPHVPWLQNGGDRGSHISCPPASISSSSGPHTEGEENAGWQERLRPETRALGCRILCQGPKHTHCPPRTGALGQRGADCVCGPEGQAGPPLGLHEVGRTGQQEQQQQKQEASPKECGVGGLGNSSQGGTLDGVGDQVALVGSEGVRPQPSLGLGDEDASHPLS